MKTKTPIEKNARDHMTGFDRFQEPVNETPNEKAAPTYIRDDRFVKQVDPAGFNLAIRWQENDSAPEHMGLEFDCTA